MGARALAERITDIQLIRPKEYQPVAAFSYLETTRIFKTTEGMEWAIEITLDGGRDNWYGAWPPPGLADESGEVPVEERPSPAGDAGS